MCTIVTRTRDYQYLFKLNIVDSTYVLTILTTFRNVVNLQTKSCLFKRSKFLPSLLRFKSLNATKFSGRILLNIACGAGCPESKIFSNPDGDINYREQALLGRAAYKICNMCHNNILQIFLAA